MHKALLTKEDTETFQDNIKQHYHLLMQAHMI